MLLWMRLQEQMQQQRGGEARRFRPGVAFGISNNPSDQEEEDEGVIEEEEEEDQGAYFDGSAPGVAEVSSDVP